MLLHQQSQDWVISKGAYNAIVEVNNKLWRLNRGQGFMEPSEEDLKLYPKLEFPLAETVSELLK